MTSSRGEFSRQPVIVVGMHRSGTTLLVRLLSRLGARMGRDITRQTAESVFFRAVNCRLLKWAGANWVDIDPFRDALKNPAFAKRAVDDCRRAMKSVRQGRYLGWSSWARGMRIAELTETWGWKDPRNTLTLPVWRQIFPEARVIHVVRNGLDVSQSLVVRDAAWRKDPWTSLKRRLLLSLPGRRERVSGADFASLHGAFSLWENYLDTAERHLADVPADCRLEFRYEDLLASPRPLLSRVAAFLGLPVSADVLDEAAGSVDSSRRFAFRLSELVDGERDLPRRPWMKRHGYDLSENWPDAGDR